MAATQRIGVLGSGDVGKRLAGGFAAAGHEVKLGTREPGKAELQEWAKSTPKASVGTFEETARFGEVLVLAVNGKGAESALRMAGPANFRGKVVIDATNPLEMHGENAPPTMFAGGTDSLAEQIQGWLPGAKVVKCFNTMANAHMVQRDLADAFLAGDDPAAKHTVAALCKELGPNPVDCGPLVVARYLEPMAMAWVWRGFTSGQWNHAFKLAHGKA